MRLAETRITTSEASASRGFDIVGWMGYVKDPDGGIYRVSSPSLATEPFRTPTPPRDSKATVDTPSWGNNIEWEEQEQAAHATASVAALSEHSGGEHKTLESLAACTNIQPVLQDLNVVYGVGFTRPGQAEYVTDTPVSAFWTDLSQEGILSMVLLLLDQRQDMRNFLQERILQSFLSGNSQVEVLSEVTRLLELFSKIQQGE